MCTKLSLAEMRASLIEARFVWTASPNTRVEKCKNAKCTCHGGGRWLALHVSAAGVVMVVCTCFKFVSNLFQMFQMVSNVSNCFKRFNGSTNARPVSLTLGYNR